MEWYDVHMSLVFLLQDNIYVYLVSYTFRIYIQFIKIYKYFVIFSFVWTANRFWGQCKLSQK